MKDILDFWVLGDDKPPRDNQIKALKWLQENKDKKYLMLELPVGGGKSAIAMTFSKYMDDGIGNSYFLTPQKILQAQYEKDFKKKHHMASLYGKSNYICAEKNTSCDIGALVKPKCSNCPFSTAVTIATQSANLVINYKLALTMFYYTSMHKKRKLLVMDECHTAEEHLTEFGSILFNKYFANKYGIKWTQKTTIESAIKWIREIYYPAATKHLSDQFYVIEPLMDMASTDISGREAKLLREYSRLEDYVDEMTVLLSIKTKKLIEDYVLIHDRESVRFKQLRGVNNFKSIVNPMADTFLFMSSTILDFKEYCKDLGIDESEAAFLSLDSDFPVKSRPVVYIPQLKMNAKWQSDEQQLGRDKLKDTILNILDIHKDEKGIIHTANFKVAEWVVSEMCFEAPHQMLDHNPGTDNERGAIIRQFLTIPNPSVLVSPSITEGLDLVDDLSRFAIIVKVPFAFLGDQWIKRRLDLSKRWYQRRALIDIIQAGGRIVRHNSDHGTVYILDGSWGYLYNQTTNIIPKWWSESYNIL